MKANSFVVSLSAFTAGTCAVGLHGPENNQGLFVTSTNQFLMQTGPAICSCMLDLS